MAPKRKTGEIPPPIVEPRPNMLHFEPYDTGRPSRSNFIVLVYCLVAALLLVALLQWQFVAYAHPVSKFFMNNSLLCAACILISMPLLALFMLVRTVRYLSMLRWLLFLVIIELLVIGICVLVATCDKIVFLIIFWVTACVMVVCLLVGSFMPCDLTKHLAELFICSVMLFSSSVFMLMIYLSIDLDPCLFIVFGVLIILIICGFTVYHAQLIGGWKYAEFSATEGLYAALVLFGYFCDVLMVLCFLDLQLRQGTLFDHKGFYPICNGNCKNIFDVNSINSMEEDQGIEYDN